MTQETGGRAGRFGLSALALVFVAGNLLAFLAALDEVPPRRERPVRHALVDTFLLYHLFTGSTERNSEPFLEGQAPGGTGWGPLDPGDFFAGRRAERELRMRAWRHEHLLAPAELERARAATARRVRERHNGLHPAEPLARVRFGLTMWPGDTTGYEDRRRESRRVVLYEEP